MFSVLRPMSGMIASSHSSETKESQNESNVQAKQNPKFFFVLSPAKEST
jgi:hypothetical protein